MKSNDQITRHTPSATGADNKVPCRQAGLVRKRIVLLAAMTCALGLVVSTVKAQTYTMANTYYATGGWWDYWQPVLATQNDTTGTTLFAPAGGRTMLLQTFTMGNVGWGHLDTVSLYLRQSSPVPLGSGQFVLELQDNRGRMVDYAVVDPSPYAGSAGFSPGTSKPATDGRFKTSHSEAGVS